MKDDGWNEEDTKGGKCVFNDELGFNIYISNERIVHVEDAICGASFSSPVELKTKLKRIQKLKKKTDTLKW